MEPHMRVLVLSIAVLLAGANLATALTYCAPDDERCRQSVDVPTSHVLIVLAALGVFVLAVRAFAWARQWLNRK
ncbi:hypothetical protein MesoLj131c_00790 [Mesorhizobium sp. 131-3-5]|nr:hypothetical protein MesoLj131c_00790 [Mesorhizobium sp. 131-3-5]